MAPLMTTGAGGYPAAVGAVATIWDPTSLLGSGWTLSNGNLSIGDNNTGSSTGRCISTTSKSAGKHYVEFLYVNSRNQSVGVATSDAGAVNSGFARLGDGGDTKSGGYARVGSSDGRISANNGSTFISVTVVADGGIIGMCIDIPNHLFYIAVNNTWQNGANPASNSGGTNYITTSPVYLAMASIANGGFDNLITLRPTSASQTYTPPSGFTAWG